MCAIATGITHAISRVTTVAAPYAEFLRGLGGRVPLGLGEEVEQVARLPDGCANGQGAADCLETDDCVDES